MLAADSEAPADFLAGTGEMGARIRAFDWTGTPLGPIECWPQSLKTSLSLILTSRHAMWIGWGAEMTFVYNDAYVPVLGPAKHSCALGRPASEIWAEIWDICGPLADKVFESGEATFVDEVRLFMDRGDFLEETFYSFSYSPIRDEFGQVSGLFCPSTDVTPKVLNARRLRTLAELARNALLEKTTAGACASAARILAKNPDDIPFALLYLAGADEKCAFLEQAVADFENELTEAKIVDLTCASDASLWPVAEVFRTAQRQIVSVSHIPGLPRGVADQRVSQAVILPVTSRGEHKPYGVLVTGINPCRPLDEEHLTFFDLLAGQVATAIQNARAVEEEKNRADMLADEALTWLSRNGHGAQRIDSHAAIAVDNARLFAKTEQEIAQRKQAEALLRESERRFRQMIDALPGAIYTTDAEGRLTYFNPAASKLSGRVPQLGTDQWCVSWKLFRPDGTPLPHDQCPMATALKDGEVTPGEECIAERPDGTRFWFTPYPTILRDHAGRIIGGINMLVDITERKRAETATLLLGAIVDSSDDAIVSKDLTGVITSWNKGAERLFGYHADEVIGKSITILIPPDRLSEEPDILSRLQRGERVDHFETIRRRKDGSLLNLSLTISPVKDGRGKIIGASKIARDITDRKRAEAALLASESRFRQLADSMPQMVWTARPDGFVDYFNERWFEFTGFDRNNFGDPGWEPILHPDDVKHCRETWYDSVRTGLPYQTECRFWDRNEKRWRWFMGRALPVKNEDGKIARWFGTCTDIDDQKRVQEELRRANQDLEQFAYSASHDLQEPLRGVEIYSELLARRYADRLDGQALQFLHYLRGSASRMEMLVRDLLEYTQVTRLEVPEESADANRALTETLASLQGAIVESGARVTSDPLPSVRVHGTHLRQLLQNLVGNAIKYRSPERVPTVHVSAQQEGGEWLFSVIDNGIGIEPEFKEKIFGVFKRLHSGDEYSGTGIGLAICQRIVERYQGRIWVESQPGQGSKFRFTLPV